MENAKRSFVKGERIYVVDYWKTKNGTQAFAIPAKIWEVDKENETFCAVLYGDTYNTYSFKDYGRLIFDTINEAIKAADKLPKPKTTIYYYQVSVERVKKERVDGIIENDTDETYDLMIRLSNGKTVSTREVGRTLFLSETDARKNKK